MVITLLGENSYLLKSELKQLSEKFIAENGDLSIESIDAEEADTARLTGALGTVDLFAPKKLIILYGASKNKDFTESFEQIISSVPETTSVVLVEREIDKRLVFYKTLKKLTDVREYKKLDFPVLAEWAVRKVKDEGGSLSLADARYLIERAGIDQQNINNELGKLMLYNPKITRESIDLLTPLTPQSNIFQLLEAAFSGKKRKAIKLYEDQREQKVEPQKIIAMITWQLNIFSLVMAAGDRSADRVAAEAKLNPYSVSKSQAIARGLGAARLKKLVSELLEIEVKAKSKRIDLDSALERYLMNL